MAGMYFARSFVVNYIWSVWYGIDRYLHLYIGIYRDIYGYIHIDRDSPSGELS